VSNAPTRRAITERRAMHLATIVLGVQEKKPATVNNGRTINTLPFSWRLRSMNNASLCEPISADAPCGVDLEDTQLLASFDAFRVFGNDTPLRADIDWREIRSQAVDALARSRDLRLLAHLAVATLRVDGLKAFCSLLPVVERWLTEQWALVFPRVDEDAVLRKNALNCFSDRMAVIDPLRRAPIAAHRQLGAFSLRDLELATGQLSRTEADHEVPSPAQIEATLAAAAVEELSSLAAEVTAASHALKKSAAAMQEQAGFQSTPDFEPLLRPLARIHTVLSEHLATRGPAVPTSQEAQSNSTGAPAAATTAPGEIGSRQDAIRAMDAIAAFFRKNEPSSPIPLLLDRAKRLVSKSFLEVLEDIAPDSVSQVRQLGGIKGEE
jgi:type VI secretion system protein ImpA